MQRFPLKPVMSSKQLVVKALGSLTGFTLIELMLVIMIIGILAGLAVPRLVGKAEQIRKSTAKTNVENSIPSILDLYEMDMGVYPQRLEDLVDAPSSDSNWNGPYLKKIPKDPWGQPYHYRCPGEHNPDYDLSSSGRDGILGSEDDVNNWE